MELTLDQALQKGVEAHKAGKVQEADQYYTAILKANPKHPDANHNMGVLAVGVGKIPEALPFFKTALEVNPNIAQYWMSYIEAFIKLDRIEDAKAVLEQAKSNGTKGDGFDQLDKRLNEIDLIKNVQEPPQDQQQSIINLYTQGQLEQALDKVSQLLQQFPCSSVLYNIKGAANRGLGQLDAAIDSYGKALQLKPDYAEAYNNLGNALHEKGKLDQAIEAFSNAISIEPNYAEAYCNMGNVLRDQGKLEEAIEACNASLFIKSDYSKAYNNLGNALKDQGRLEEAIEAYTKAIFINPDYAEAYNNLGTALHEKGTLEKAIEAYNKAIAINPDYADAIQNCQSLAVQLLPIITNYGYDFDDNDTQINSELVQWPKYQIQDAIKAYLEENFTQADLQNNNFKACDQKLFRKLAPKDKIFCIAYSTFIGKLLDANRDNALTITTENKVYHLGESHCLTYAHQNITIGGSSYKIVPRMTFGAKAFHFSRSKHDSFKAITKAHFASLPEPSKIFISFGEIDCRPTEGFMAAVQKHQKPIEDLVYDTVRGYVGWFAQQNHSKNHNLFFLNVPAPIYNEKFSAEVNEKAASTIKLFNSLLHETTSDYEFNIIDVYKFTVGRGVFSNGLFHIDDIHLSSDIIPEIEKQIGTFL